jgi:hypothetical protein
MIIQTFVGVALAASVAVNPGDDIQALTSSLLPGDTVTFMAGTFELDGTVYWGDGYEGPQGTEDAPITFRADTDAEVILRNNGGGYVAYLQNASYVIFEDLIFEGGGEDISYTQPSGLGIDESNHVTVQNCTIRNVWGTALRIDGNSDGMVITNNELSGTGDGSGLYVGCYDASCWMQGSSITNNLIHDIEGTGINLQNGTQSTVVRDNVIFRTRDSGLYAGSTALGPQLQILGNAIWNVGGDGLYLQGSALVQNNVIFEVTGDGIYTRDDYGSLTDMQISHNTIVNTNGYAAYLEDWYFASNMVFANNALSNPLGRGLRWDDELVDNYGEPTGVEETTNYTRNNVVTGLVEGYDLLLRPDFVIPGGGVGDFEELDNFDFYPTADSVLRDAADPSGEAYLPETDFNGTQRDGASPDVGAYEYDGDGNPGWVIAETFKSTEAPDPRTDAGLSTGCCKGGSAAETATTQTALMLPFLGLGWWRRRSRPAAR